MRPVPSTASFPLDRKHGDQPAEVALNAFRHWQKQNPAFDDIAGFDVRSDIVRIRRSGAAKIRAVQIVLRIDAVFLCQPVQVDQRLAELMAESKSKKTKFANCRMSLNRSSAFAYSTRGMRADCTETTTLTTSASESLRACPGKARQFAAARRRRSP